MYFCCCCCHCYCCCSSVLWPLFHVRTRAHLHHTTNSLPPPCNTSVFILSKSLQRASQCSILVSNHTIHGSAAVGAIAVHAERVLKRTGNQTECEGYIYVYIGTWTPTLVRIDDTMNRPITCWTPDLPISVLVVNFVYEARCQYRFGCGFRWCRFLGGVCCAWCCRASGGISSIWLGFRTASEKTKDEG